MTRPLGAQATYCLARSVVKFASELTPSRSSNRNASGPSRKSSGMWCDWWNSTAVSFQARCSSRQLVYAGGMNAPVLVTPARLKCGDWVSL